MKNLSASSLVGCKQRTQIFMDEINFSFEAFQLHYEDVGNLFPGLILNQIVILWSLIGNIWKKTLLIRIYWLIKTVMNFHSHSVMHVLYESNQDATKHSTLRAKANIIL